MAGRTGCGLCGTESLDHVVRPVAPLRGKQVFSAGAIARGMDDLVARQSLHKVTGAVHAAAWGGDDGRVRLIREDVGHHNALDKHAGALVKGAHDASNGFIAVTSRAGFEMVQKTVAAGVPLLAAVSAPTSLAVALAGTSGLCLAGFVRGHDLVVYAHPERLPGLPSLTE